MESTLGPVFVVFGGDSTEYGTADITFEVFRVGRESQKWESFRIPEILEYGFKSEGIKASTEMLPMCQSDVFKFVETNFDTNLI